MKLFRYEFNVDFCDVDFGGGLYHPNYYKHLDTARVTALREVGLPFSSFIKDQNALVVANISSNFYAPAFLDERLTILTEIKEIKRSSLLVEQLIFKNEVDDNFDLSDESFRKQSIHCSNITLVYVCLKTKRAVSIPEKLLEALA